jgi:hypothetical protein
MSESICPLLDALLDDRARNRELARVVEQIAARVEDGRLDRSEGLSMLLRIKASIEAGEDHHA